MVTTTTKVLEAKASPAGQSVQWAELYALVQALTLSEGKRISVHTDARDAFAPVSIQGAGYKERGLLTAAEKTIRRSDFQRT